MAEKIKNIKITQIKSAIGYRKRAKQTLVALGITRMNQSVVHAGTAAILGMVRSISHLLKVEEI
ncbi:MAG: 50S ribosomal protein L30 [FCB group bacterium]|nr:50S ribosomal protein L30 [FCB group bacterium]